MAGKIKVFTLTYADEMVLLADTAADLREILKIIQVYLDRRFLELNTEKTKIVTLSRSGQMAEDVFKYNGTELEKVKTFTYLG